MSGTPVGYDSIDKLYAAILHVVYTEGDVINTRNAHTYSKIDLPHIILRRFPLITIRKTAWRKAIREMEWFMSGYAECPDILLDWWNGQLNPDDEYIDGYGYQMRSFTYLHRDVSDYGVPDIKDRDFDQIKYILDGLKSNPNSRRLILTTWNPGEMAHIMDSNENANTPTCCHNSLTQFFVRDGQLHLKTYQRSADLLLGVPHNWVQEWALMLYFAYHAGLQPGTIIWSFGDAHLYMEKSHLQVYDEIQDNIENVIDNDVSLEYKPTNIEYDWNGVPVFKESDFNLVGEIPQPLVTLRPKLL